MKYGILNLVNNGCYGYEFIKTITDNKSVVYNIRDDYNIDRD